MESNHGNGEDFAFFEFAALVSWQRPAPAADARPARRRRYREAPQSAGMASPRALPDTPRDAPRWPSDRRPWARDPSGNSRAARATRHLQPSKRLKMKRSGNRIFASHLEKLPG
jgi:hypothetical protein